MAARVARHVSLARASILVFIAVALLTALFMVKMSQGEALPGGPTDSTAVPHYFGPWTNWALSPLTLPDATVTITGNGTGAAATATVGGNGAVTGITVTNPGSGYTTATVAITGAGTGAAASATLTNSGAVTAITVGQNGGGYKSPTVTISGGGATTDATATAYGGVTGLTLQNAGTGYQFPTVDFDMPDDPNGTKAQADATIDANGVITGITITNPGSGYATAPNVVIRDGTLMDPVANAGAGASAVATIDVTSVGLDTFGAGYTSTPSVTISDAVGNGTGATATAAVDNGLVSAIAVTAPGTGYVTGTGIRKFVDQLPGLYDPLSGAPTAAKYIPLGVPEVKSYLDPNNTPIKADEYEIALVQYRTKFSTDLPGTLVRGYVQVETASWVAAHPGVSQHFPLQNELLNGNKVNVLINGQQAYGVTEPQWLGPTIVATKNKPVRIVFRNLLPTGADGDLFLPVDSTLMGSGMGPMGVPDPADQGTVMDGVRNPVCTEAPKSPNCFKDNRATLHLHGGISPWISDGTPHQWITPPNETTPWPQGVDVVDVPDMTPKNVPNDGVQTFFYTNQQSARLMFYHDHAWGITRLNVYAGEAAGYIITDDKEKELLANGTLPADQIPLVVQDRTFVPPDAQLYDTATTYGQDPTWNKARWGGYGSFWYHHVYMPAQNPGDPGGMSAYGRWMYGPWFWPPAAATTYGPIDNPYYDPNCDLNNPATWTYDTDPFCEPAKIPGTPNISAGMEQFNDTPIVNGVAYPEVTLQPKTYRFRVLNAANDRFFNFQWYVADPTTGTDSEVALDPLLLAQAQTDPVVFPTPVHNASTTGPDWVQIGTEGGFLPKPVVVDGQQETTWITDPTRFDVGNVDLHSLLLAPAERADVIVDFSKFAGKTLILYNDAPAAFPARVPSYDYYTGQPDLSPNGPAAVLPGYGPNTRTVMRVKIAAAAPAAAFNLTKLNNAFSHKTNGSGVFESSQHPIIVGQAAYNSAYGTSFSTGSDCNAIGTAVTICDGYVRVNDTQVFGFNTLKNPTTKTSIPLQPKAIHDEMNATTFDEFGRMQANLGIEAQPPTPGLQNVTLYPFVNPVTEIIDGTNLPKNAVVYDVNGNAVSDVKITPISNGNDGTQLWRVTHNGVDTHPIHFHLYDVQILNRVTWDNIIIPPDTTELGWKDTVRMAPLEDTVVALRPIVPQVPWEVPNAIKMLNPMDPAGSTKLFFNVDPQGNPTNPITNQLVNYGWGYVWHCHILSHEEMDMMRPQSLVLPPVAPSNLSNTLQNAGGANRRAVLTWNDNSINETAQLVQRSTNLGGAWTTITTINSPLANPNIHQTRTYTDTSAFNPNNTTRYYRVIAQNTVGYVADTAFPQATASSNSNTRIIGPQFTITASAGAGGSITPSGAVAVGRGGSQAFTITPNAGFRINQVLVVGPTGTTDVTTLLVNNTYTIANVQANQTITASFTQSQATITASAGAGGSIAPSGVQTVAIGGNQTYTITPNNGYTIADVVVDAASVGAVGTYTFTNVTVNHTISVTFAPNLAITVTVPSGVEAWTTGSAQNLGWTLNTPVSTGQFGVWLVNQTSGTWYEAGFFNAVAGQNNYAPGFTVPAVPDGTYKSVVYYRADPAQWVWSTNAMSANTATITQGGMAITVTVPLGIESWATGSTQNLGWTLNAAVSTGQFGVWLINQTSGVWYDAGYFDAVAAQTSYTPTFTVPSVPVGSYKAVVYYRTDPTQWVWQANAMSLGAATITPAGLVIDVTVPNGSENWTAGSTQSLGWTVSSAVSAGQFGVWLVNQTSGTWYEAGYFDAVALQTVYTPNFVVPVVPAGTYKAVVYYRTDPTQWVWLTSAYSTSTAAVGP